MALRIRKTIGIEGMTCNQCEKAIHRELAKVDGVTETSASFSKSSLCVVYDSLMTDEDHIRQAIRNAGYEVAADKPGGKRKPGSLSPLQLAGAGVLLIAIYLLIDKTVGFNFIPQIKSSMGYGMLLLVGLLTSLHCIAMCGGINLSQCLVQKPDGSSQAGWKPSLLYNGGRVISYTVVGGVVGALGSVVSFSGAARGIVAILAGLFMVIMGINMLGLVPALRRFQIRIPAGIRDKLMGKSGERGPFIVGLLNGLMPCGPLQAMQLYALGTGSALAGALSMLAFSLGTVPLMFGFGAISTMLSKKFTRSILRFSAVLVVILGLVMMQRGFSLGGIQVFGLSSFTQKTSAATVSKPPAGTSDGNGIKIDNGFQIVKGDIGRGAYPAITVQKGIPVKLNLYAAAGALNGCNRTVVIPELTIQVELQPGDNIVEFTAPKAGKIGYTCWMGMISGTITVTE